MQYVASILGLRVCPAQNPHRFVLRPPRNSVVGPSLSAMPTPGLRPGQNLAPERPLNEETRLRLCSVQNAPGPRDRWRKAEDVTAATGNSLSPTACRGAGVEDRFLKLWFRGIELEARTMPDRVQIDDYPSVRQQAEVAGEELDRLTALGKIHWYQLDSPPPDLRVCPSQLIVKPDKVRLVHDWSNPQYRLNSLLSNPPVAYGSMDSFLAVVSPGGYMAGLDLQDCFMHWLVSPRCRRWLGVRHPVTRQLGCYLFLPFGLGPSPGWNDACVKEVLRVCLRSQPKLYIVDFVDDLRLTEQSGEQEPLQQGLDDVRTTGGKMGIRFHTKEKKLIQPTRRIPWLGFIICTDSMEVQLDPQKKVRALKLIHDVLEAPGGQLRAKDLLRTVSFLNFLEVLVPGGFAHLRSGWNIVNESGVMEEWRVGRRTNPIVSPNAWLRNDLRWWKEAVLADPVKSIQELRGRCFIWHPRLADLQQKVLDFPAGGKAVWFTDASGLIGWGATFGDLYIQGPWPPEALREHINWKELYVLTRCLAEWGSLVEERLILVRMDNTTAISYANYGSGRVPSLTALAREIKSCERMHRCHIIALHVPGAENNIADALSRYRIEMCRLDRFPERSIRPEFFRTIERMLGPFICDMAASSDGHNALCPTFRHPDHSAFLYPWPEGKIWWFPRTDQVEDVLRAILTRKREGWGGTAVVLVPAVEHRRWNALADWFRVYHVFPAATKLFRIRVQEGSRTLWRILSHPESHPWNVLVSTVDTM